MLQTATTLDRIGMFDSLGQIDQLIVASRKLSSGRLALKAEEVGKIA